ncbi:hypothetical protein A2U01_0081643, partial [Trifolium medium]|nr:hypothetical protein [Trifolium medium]
MQRNRITLRVVQHRLARCAGIRRLNCPAAMNCVLRQKQIMKELWWFKLQSTQKLVYT